MTVAIGTEAASVAPLRSALETLSAAQRYRDPFTCKHEDRAAELAAAIATRMGLPPVRVETLRLAAVVHDIGKIGVPTEIVGKAGTLTEPEFALMRTHCVIGYEILEHLRSPFPVSEIAYQHHERLDGSGYPRGLSGDAILIEARILAVADVFDAMSTHRAYRAALPIDFVLAELHKQSGSTLDPNAVDACTAHVLTQSGRASMAASARSAGAFGAA